MPGKKKSFPVGYHTLWQGEDHILSIDSRFGIENYKRFYFADIQSIIVHKTDSGKTQNGILCLILSVFVLMAFTLEGGLARLGGIMAGCFVVFLAVNWFRGPTCVTHLRTAVQNEKLPSLDRLHTAQKVMDHLRSIIENVQGPLTGESLNQNFVKQQKPGSGGMTSTSSSQTLKSLRSESGLAHFFLFSLMLLDGLLILINAQFHMVTLTLLGMAIYMGVGICIIIALVKQRGSDIPKALGNLTWVGLVYVCVSFVLGQIHKMVLFFQNPTIMGNHWKLMELTAAMSFFENPFVSILNILTLFGAICLGIPGLLLVDKHRREI